MPADLRLAVPTSGSRAALAGNIIRRCECSPKEAFRASAGFVPDVVISFATPIDFLARSWPETLRLHEGRMQTGRRSHVPSSKHVRSSVGVGLIWGSPSGRCASIMHSRSRRSPTTGSSSSASAAGRNSDPAWSHGQDLPRAAHVQFELRLLRST
jgi:hypothetical protein